MFPDLSLTQAIAISALATVVLLLPIWVFLTRRKRKKFKPGAAMEMVADAQFEEGEKHASLVSEQIEERVKQILAEQGHTLDEKIDFGTASDGSLEIWIEENAYTSVDKIPDEIVRSAVAKAVEEFNV